MRIKPVATAHTLIALILFSLSTSAQNDVMLQGFYWDVPVDIDNKNGFWYDSLSAKMEEIKEAGFTEIWLPPPSKGNWGIADMGYGIHDHYDLGKYHQIDTRETRFGSFEELQELIKLAHDTSNGSRINLLADVVLNHMYSTQQKDYEVNPALKNYIVNEAVVDGQSFHPYPVNEMIWKISEFNSSPVSIKIKCFESQSLDEWSGDFTLELDTNLQSLLSSQRIGPQKLNEGNKLAVPQYYAGRFLAEDTQLHFDVDLPAAGNLFIRVSARQRIGNKFTWTDQAKGIYISALKTPSQNLYDRVELLTTTGIHYVDKEGLPDLRWNYSFFHPGFDGDFLSANLIDDQVTPALKWFGHDLNHANPLLIDRMVTWGRWLRDSVGYDGFRLDFVMGVDERFMADWINRVWLEKDQSATMVAEYFSENKMRIKEWADYIANQSPNTQLKVFDFPLKFELNKMCHSNPEDYDMRNLLYAGMLFDTLYSLPADRLVSFVDNHDTGKESDKWLTQDWEMAYAYIFFMPAQPCVFYNHFFGEKQKDYSREGEELEIPSNLKKVIKKLTKIRKEYLSGEIVHVSDNSDKFRNLYIAFRTGNNACNGAFLTLAGSVGPEDSPSLSLDEDFNRFYGKELINLLHPSESVRVDDSGVVSFRMNGHGEGIWIMKDDLKP